MDIFARTVADMKTHVRIASPMGSTFDGCTGTVVRVDRVTGTLMVRVHLRGRGHVVIPFAPSEVLPM